MIQLYGHFSNHLSFAQVSRGLARGFQANGCDVSIWSIEEFNQVAYIDVPAPIGLNSDAPVGLAVGYPTIAAPWLRAHDVRVLMTVCETDRIPSPWVKACQEVDWVCVPSQFCKDAFVTSGVPLEKVVVLPHGVDTSRIIKINTGRVSTQLLHFSGSLSFPWRKGTVPLLRALQNVTGVDITIISNNDKLDQVVARLGLNNVTRIEPPVVGLSRHQMHQLFSKHDAVIQPSRGEGFGMIPLEARCAGIPVIMTPTTGHAEHLATCDTIINVDTWDLMATQGNSVGSAPTVSAQAIKKSIQQFDRGKAHKNTLHWANNYGKLWLWKETVKFFAIFLRTKYKPRGITLRQHSGI